MDLIELLRKRSGEIVMDWSDRMMMLEAADEIERIRSLDVSQNGLSPSETLVAFLMGGILGLLITLF